MSPTAEPTGTRLRVQIVAFHAVKAGNAPWEQEDAFGYDPGNRFPGLARCIVVDGATEAYDSTRWVRQLVTGFLSGEHGPRPAAALSDLDEWFDRMQATWAAQRPEFHSLFEERKYHDSGSFATMLCCHINLDASPPRWRAAALGDTVLFHVRDATLLGWLPHLEPADFGLNPEGVFTLPSQRERMRAALTVSAGDLACGDTLYIATDALAHWILQRREQHDQRRVWDTLAGLIDPGMFTRFVADLRGAGELKNDDVTLMRVACTDQPVNYLILTEPGPRR